MTDQVTLKKIIKDQREAITGLEKAVSDLRNKIELQEQFDRDYDMQISENTKLKGKIEAANKKLLEKLKAWRDAYSLEANDLQAEAIRDLEEVWDAVHIPRKEEATKPC